MPFGALERLWFLGLAVLLVGRVVRPRRAARRPGRAMNTIRDHEIAAGVMGVPVGRYRAGVFVLSSMYAGGAGVMLALVFQRTVPEYFGMLLSLDYLAMIVIGGLGSVAGAVVGAVFVSFLPQLLTRYSDALPLVAEPGSGGRRRRRGRTLPVRRRGRGRRALPPRGAARAGNPDPTRRDPARPTPRGTHPLPRFKELTCAI